ncbi:BlaI/MecI/CopY family transcriptional regulator [Enterococcus eurekensis]|mgnify:CR=1 FL=1|uniref:BlaI/MecI/CopY family transcriptional regulator n=2 Tax=Enterococcus TaxID=1350 RepID=A0ABV9M1M5_9ENTE|nr:BlaI/MecI/CopY family transcriptional regulator [Candidatus Enterococcus avicola]
MKITNKELEILQILWASETALNAKQISEFKEGMIMSTVQTTLRKLLQKDLIRVDDIIYSGTVLSRTFTPTLTQEAFIAMQYKNLSIANFVSHLLKNKKSKENDQELKEVYELLKEKTEGK